MVHRIYLISSTVTGLPMILELMENLQYNGIEIFNIDILSCRQRNVSGKVDDIYSNFILKMLYKIPRLRVYIRIFCSRIYIKKNIKKNDIVVFHFLDPNYIKFINQLKKKTDNLIVHWWGSDLYRSDKKDKEKIKKINEKIKKHILVAGMYDYFIKHFPSEMNKIRYAVTGVKLFDVIKNLQKDFESETQKSKLSIPRGKIVITGSYNGSPGQQHQKIIESISQLPDLIKMKIFLILPMTYGSNKEYIKRIKDCLKGTKIEHKILTNYIPEGDLAILRLITDITINIQITDGFSASIRESLFAGNILVVGNWLPYEELKKWGVFFIETSLNELKNSIENTIFNLEKYKLKSHKNSEIMYNNSSWNSCIKNIIKAYTD